MKLKFSVLLVLGVLCQQTIKSQAIRNFSQDPAVFFEELKTFFTAADKKTGKELMEALEPSWETYFSAGHKKIIIDMSNQMLKKRMNAIPNFRDYVKCLIGFSASDKSREQFDSWHLTLDKTMAQVTTAKFVQYLNISESLIVHNALYKSEAVSWTINRSDFKFDFDSIPKVIIPPSTLTGKTRSDSTIIENTSGVLYPVSYLFNGENGKVLWTRAGLPENEAYATLKRYSLTTKTTKFTADSALFHFPKYFNTPLSGEFSDKLTDNPASRDATYPRFSTYDTEFNIPGLYKDIDYKGGISVQGAKLIGSGNETTLAQIWIYREGQPFFRVRSKTFMITDKSLQSSTASIFIQLDQDSIVHPGLVFRYLDEKKEVFLLRNNEGSAKSPYFNSYHQIDMDFEVLSWKVDEPTMRFTAIPGAVESRGKFESADYFREERFIEIQGIDQDSPLMVLRKLSEKTGNRREFSSKEIANHYRIEITQVRHILRRLAYMGFLQFDEETEQVVLQDRLFKYLLARNGKADYDVIQFKSNVGGASDNARMSLLNFDIRMFGVERIFLSDSQNVIIYPKNQELILHKNRNFDFAGRILAGRFEFFGKKFDFDYDKFKLNLENVDSLRLRVEKNEKDEFGNRPLVVVRTVIENVIGDILIDHPMNKSGVKALGQYPIFNSVKPSYAYYDRSSILGAVYDRSRFYFQLDPYQVDSLNNFTNEGLYFDGTFVTANIFPDLREQLRLQEDYSLGLKRNTGTAGLPIYQSKGDFFDDLQMSHKGLRGNGRIEYLTTTAKSKDFVFYPDSVNAFCESLNVRAESDGKVEFPDVEAADVKLHWEPYQPNKFEIAQTKEAIVMYSGESKLKGKISIGEDGMSGSGTLEFASAEVASNKFRFKKEDFKSDTASFAFTARDEYLADGTKEVAIRTDNVKADVSFKNRQGQFKSNSADSYIEFPVNKYIAYMDELRWYMDEDEVDMNSSMNEIDLIGSRFVSLKPDQDSLTFVAPKAKYALSDRTIRTEGVKLIRVADATIYPNEEKVNVERNALMTTLTKSRINANNDLKYHDIYNATIDILGKKRYKASGEYDYEDEIGKVQKIILSSVSIDSAGNTIATGQIKEEQNFSLSPQFEFKGKVNLFAPEKFLTFDGGARIVHNCEKVNRNWLQFKSLINPADIMIPVDSFPKSLDNEKLTAGLVLIKDSTHVYPVFMSKKQKAGDQDIIQSRGILKFNKASQEFQLTSKEKYNQAELIDDFVAVKQANCDLRAEGKMNFGLDLGQVKLWTYGSANHSIETDLTKFKTTIAIDFFFSPDCLKMIEDAIQGSSGLQPSDVSSAEYKKSILALIGKESADKMFKDMGATGTIKKFPEELEKTFVFTNVELKWNTESRSYVSEGWLHLSNIGKTPVNKVIKGKIELIKKRGGDILNFYIEPESNKWYFFNYTRNIMSVIGGEETFNKIIRELDSNKREQKAESGGPPYQFAIGIEKRKRDFLER